MRGYRKLVLPAALVAVAVSGAGSVPAANHTGCQVVVEVPTPPPSPGVPPPAGISAAATEDVTVAVLLPFPLSGDQVVVVKFFTPRGHLYQEVTLPIRDTPQEVALPGFAWPLPAQVPVRVEVAGRPVSRIATTLPVGGTSIVAASLFGTWGIEAYLNGEARPCGPRATLEIRP